MFQDFFCSGTENCRRLLKIHYVIAIHLMRWLTNFYDFEFKWTVTAGIGIYPTKAWLSQLVNFKMQSGIEDTSEERYAIKSCFKLGKNDATETYGMIQTEVEILFDHLAWIEHQFLSGIRDSSKVGSLWGMMRGMGGVRKSEHLSWLAKGLGLGLLCWGFKGVQEKIPLEETSTLQIGSVQSHFHQNNAPVYNSILIADYLTKSPALAPCNFCLFPKLRDCRYETIEEMKEAMMKIIDTLTQEDLLGAFQKLLERYNKCIAVWGDYFEGN